MAWGGLRTTSPRGICTVVTRGRENGNLRAGENLLLWGILGGGGGVRSVLPTSPTCWPGRACRGARHRGVTAGAGGWEELRVCYCRPRSLGEGGKAGGWAGSGPTRHPAQPRAGSLLDRALCCWLPPGRAGKGL